jgi:phage gpG-like protein
MAKVAYRVGTNLIYAPIQEFGGTIKAKNAKFLAFQMTGTNIVGDEFTGTVFAKQVTIPAHPYLRPAADDKGPAAARETGRVLSLQLERIWGAAA